MAWLIHIRRCLALVAIGLLAPALLVIASPSLAAARSLNSADVSRTWQLVAVGPGAATYKEALPGGITAYVGVAQVGQSLLGLPPGLEPVAQSGMSSVKYEPSAVPLNATGWNQDVYIHIYSVGTSGPKIRYWWTSTVAIYGYHCAAATYWAGKSGDNKYYATGSVCQGTNTYAQYWASALTFGSGRTFNGQELCNTWTDPPFPGRPCEGVS